MKTRNFLLTACMAVLALVACNKNDDNHVANNRLKSVEISLENVLLSQTRGLAGDKIEDGTPVTVTDFQVFLTDEQGNEYTAKTADGSAAAKSYWPTEDVAALGETAQFHYVDPNCTKVIAIANMGRTLTFAEYKALENLAIGDEQNAKDLRLFAEETLQASGEQHQDVNVDGTTYVSDVYEANLTLCPRISRFEVDGFRINFSSTPKYNTINITDIAFQNYYPETSLATGVEAGDLVEIVDDLTVQADVYNWFNDKTKPTDWYWDSFDLTINATDAVTAKATPEPLAYHIFSGNEAPVFIIRLLVDGTPAYLYSKGFYSATEKDAEGKPKKIETFEEGKIYRMSAAGEVGTSGFIPIDDDDIDPMDRCLDITVEVVDWVVELVYPEF